MKNTIKALVLVLTFVICLSSCVTETLTAAEQKLATLAEIIGADHDSYTISVEVKGADSHVVTSTYNVRTENGVKVADYRTEKINSFVIDNGTVTVPDSYMSVTEGTLSGNDVPVPKFDFSGDSVKDILDANGIVSGSITSFESFCGDSTLSFKKGKFVISYTDESVNYLKVYITTGEGDSVTLKITF